MKQIGNDDEDYGVIILNVDPVIILECLKSMHLISDQERDPIEIRMRGSSVVRIRIRTRRIEDELHEILHLLAAETFLKGLTV